MPSQVEPTQQPPLALVANRECGTCTACCTLLHINAAEFTKPAGVTCTNCTGSGCNIYSNRPDICRAYYCFWRLYDVLAEQHRPDRAGILFQITTETNSSNPLRRRYLMGIATTATLNLSSPQVVAILAPLRAFRVPVWIQLGPGAVCVHPSSEIQRVLSAGAEPRDATVAQEAAAWREALLGL
jgi:hypothetical protein